MDRNSRTQHIAFIPMEAAMLIDILQGVLPMLTTMEKNIEEGGIITIMAIGIILKMGAKMWQSPIFQL